MKIGIIGLPQVGKKTLFGLLTGQDLSQASFTGKEEVKFGAAIIRDARFDALVDMYRPQKRVPALLDVVLLPKFDREKVASGEFLKAVERCDCLCHIVRVFEDSAVFHIAGSVDPFRDIENVCAELILNDLILIEKRLERLEKELKNKTEPQQVREREILAAMKQTLDEGQVLLTFPLSPDDQKIMSTYQFVTRRPLILVLNVNDNKLADGTLLERVKEKFGARGVRVMQISAKIEQELNALPEGERAAFLNDLNIRESALNLLSQLYFEALGLISFFTVGEDEVRQWTTRKGSTAPEASGVIHSDMQRGFIRAEIMKYAELMACGSENKLKETGKVYLKGKDYIVEDGDILHVRFNV
jgi:ribosome-binding ATPase